MSLWNCDVIMLFHTVSHANYEMPDS